MLKNGLTSKIKKVSIVEFSGHNEVVSSVAKMFVASGIEVQIFCTKGIYDFCSDLHGFSDQVSWFINDIIDHNVFLDGQNNVIAKSDLVLITTIDTINRTFVNVNWPVPSFAIIHDLYITFEPFKNLMEHISVDKASLLRLLKYFKSVLIRENRRRQSAIDKIDHLLVPSENILKHAMSKSWFEGSKILGALPFYNYLESPREIKNEHLSIVVPGTVSNKSRDYYLLYDVVAQVTFPRKTEIILLGNPYLEEGKAILKMFSSLNITNIKIVSFIKEIPQSKYDDILKKSDFIIAPLKKYMDYIFCKERTGYSCISGNINDIVKFATPALLPSSFTVDPSLQPLVDQYNGKDQFVSLLQDWVGNESYESKSEAFVASKHGMTARERGLDFLELVEGLI